MIFFVLATMIAQQAFAQQSCPSLIVSNNNDLVNGDISSLCALIANPGPNGISLRAALFAANNATGPGIITITFAQALAGQTISTTGGLGNPNLSRDGIAIIGLVDGNGQPTVTIDASSMGSNGILLPVVASNFTLQSLRFTGIEQSTSGPAFGVFIRAGELFGSPGNQQISGITISGNRFANTSSSSTGGNFISLGMESGSNGTTVSDVSITGNTFSNFQGDADGILVGVGGTNNIVQNVVIAGNTFSNITFPVELCACDQGRRARGGGGSQRRAISRGTNIRAVELVGADRRRRAARLTVEVDGRRPCGDAGVQRRAPRLQVKVAAGGVHEQRVGIDVVVDAGEAQLRERGDCGDGRIATPSASATAPPVRLPKAAASASPRS